jgi:hypothetical protein
MADLTTTVTESVVLNGALRGNTNSVTTTGINDVFERIVTCVRTQRTTIANFDTFPYTSSVAINVTNAKYIRVTNLDSTNPIELAIQTTTSSYTITITAGNSHILSEAAAIALGEVGAPTFGTMLNLSALIVQPVGAFDIQVGVFVAVE